jgi:hypothetical protein
MSTFASPARNPHSGECRAARKRASLRRHASRCFIAESEILVLTDAERSCQHDTALSCEWNFTFHLETVMSPNPTALRSLVNDEDVDEHRSVCCAEYDQCLDAALRNSWRSWSCARCKLFRITRQRAPPSGAQTAVVRPLA